jgi:TetR/AcrR family transcriptional repressor of nem operon
VTAYVRAQLDRFSHLLKGGTAASRRKRAIATLAGIIGALMLARAVEDPDLSEEILAAAQDAFGEGPAVKPK